MIPNLPIIQVLIVLQNLNAAMLPILLVFVILLVNDHRLMGKRVNSPLMNILSWATIIFISALVVLWLLNVMFGIAL
jgi:Mn2+/Fe2+ NRAMP family transporter